MAKSFLKASCEAMAEYLGQAIPDGLDEGARVRACDADKVSDFSLSVPVDGSGLIGRDQLPLHQQVNERRDNRKPSNS
jgi:hypothetical protein